MSRSRSMTALAQEYLAYRRNPGFQLRTAGQQLLQFAQYVDSTGYRGPITTDLALQWAVLPQSASARYQASRLGVVRCFAKYRAAFDPRTEIPPDGILGPTHRRTQPYIYSNKEILDLIAAAAQLRPPGGLRPKTYATLIGLLASTGLRISEALALTRDDVSLDQGLLMVRETKFHKSRLVPLHPSTTQALRNYACLRDQYRTTALSEVFLLTERGNTLVYSTVYSTFRSLLRQLPLRTIPGSRPPRIHDLRHTFATRRLLKWHHEGVDVDHAIPALSTYLGHVKVSDTYWYITAIPELLALSGSRFEQFVTQQKGDRQ